MRTGQSVYRILPDDPQAIVLGSPEYLAFGDGIGDDTKTSRRR